MAQAGVGGQVRSSNLEGLNTSEASNREWAQGLQYKGLEG